MPHREAKPLFSWLAVGLVLVIGWSFYNHAIAPLRHSLRTTSYGIEELKQNISSAETALEEIRVRKEQVARTWAEVDLLVRDIPTASALFWFPVRMKRHFTRFAIPDAVTRLNSTLDEPTFPNYQRTYWAVELPMQSENDISKVLLAVAELDAQDVLVRVLDFAIRPSSEDPTKQISIINVAALARR